MHFGVLSDPTHFHTKKWVKGLLSCGQKVTVFSFVKGEIPGATCVYIPPRFAKEGTATYLSFLFTGSALRKALISHKVDILNPINLTPYGVWAKNSGFKPLVSIAMGADILEYPPPGISFDIPDARRWEKQSTQKSSFIQQFISQTKRAFFRRQVKKALEASDFITGDNLLLVHAVKDWFQVKNVELNRWGIEEELFDMNDSQEKRLREKFSLLPDQKVVLSPRGMKPLYQGDIIYEAFESLLRKGHTEKFILLSAGYEVPYELDQKAQRLAREFPNFHYERGVIPREDACLLWNFTDVFVSAPVYDGYSNALSEGRYAGAVPVVNNIPATQELLKHQKNAWICEPFTPMELAKSLGIILGDLDTWKNRFSPVNRTWILENAHLKANMKAFVEACENLL